MRKLLILPALLLFIHIMLALSFRHYSSGPASGDLGFGAAAFVFVDMLLIMFFFAYLLVSFIYTAIQIYRNRQVSTIAAILLIPLSVITVILSVKIAILMGIDMDKNPFVKIANLLVIQSKWWWLDF